MGLSASLDRVALMAEMIISKILGPPEVTERLQELGLVVGEQFEVIRQFPFSGPWVLMTRHGMVALRDDEFQCLKSEPR